MRNNGPSWRCDNTPPAVRFFRDRDEHNFSDIVHDPFRCCNRNTGPGLSSSLRLAEELRMKIPREFEQFVRCIYPGIPHESGSLESLASAALEDWGADQRRVVLAFLSELLD